MSFSSKSNNTFNEDAKVVLTNFGNDESYSLALSQYKTLFAEIINAEDDHHSCSASAGPLTCSAMCGDAQACTCSTGQFWWGGFYCNCSCTRILQ